MATNKNVFFQGVGCAGSVDQQGPGHAQAAAAGPSCPRFRRKATSWETRGQAGPATLTPSLCPLPQLPEMQLLHPHAHHKQGEKPRGRQWPKGSGGLGAPPILLLGEVTRDRLSRGVDPRGPPPPSNPVPWRPGSSASTAKSRKGSETPHGHTSKYMLYKLVPGAGKGQHLSEHDRRPAARPTECRRLREQAPRCPRSPEMWGDRQASRTERPPAPDRHRTPVASAHPPAALCTQPGSRPLSGCWAAQPRARHCRGRISPHRPRVSAVRGLRFTSPLPGAGAPAPA